MNRKSIAILLVSVFMLAAAGAVLPACTKTEEFLPEVLAGRSFIYDELDTETGTSLYTLMFTDSGFRLYEDGGKGIISSGPARADEETKELVLQGEGEKLTGSYRGGRFEEPCVILEAFGREMKFVPATETAEYVYTDYLGVYAGKTGDSTAVLILDRWNEYYLYLENALSRGTYEIFNAEKIVLTDLDGSTYEGGLSASENFDARNLRMDFNADSFKGSLSWCKPSEEYEAAHAMGTYTLSKYPENIFVIRGVDGFVKAMGTLDEGSDGFARYFARMIAGQSEEDSTYQVHFTAEEDVYHFPADTPLLPRSGNIDKETGTGAYWNAGTALEFIKKADAQQTDARDLYEQNTVLLANNFPNERGELKSIMPTSGIVKPLVLLIEFPDFHRPRHVTKEAIERQLFSLDEASSLGSFYYRSSYGRLTIDGQVCDWYRTRMNRADYSSDTEIMAEAINYFIEEKGLQLSDYDSDGNGIVDSLYVFWAGNMEGKGGMWDSAYRSTWYDCPADWDAAVSGYIFVPGITIWSSVPPLKCNINSLTHETGHLLGLNDYYSYDTSERKDRAGNAYTGGALEGGLGGMDMMDTNTGEHNIFSKYLLGWAEPDVIEAKDIPSLNGKTITIRPSAVSPDGVLIKLRPSEDMFTEVLAIEVVAPVANASEYTRLKEPVVRIIHVNSQLPETDDAGNWRSFGFRYDNSYTSTKYIGILEADGKDEILSYLPSDNAQKISYETEDYFKAGDIIGPSTYPNTNACDELGNTSLPTGLVIKIKSLDADGTAQIELSYQKPEENLKVTGCVPSAAAVPYRAGSEAEKIPAGSSSIEIKYDADIDFTSAADAVALVTGNEIVENVQIHIEGNRLIIEPEGGFEPNCDYRVLIRANTLESADGSGRTNDYLGIYGFISE